MKFPLKVSQMRSKLSYLVVLVLLCVSQVNAKAFNEKFKDCVKISGDSQRLACFDALATTPKTKATTSTIKAAVEVPTVKNSVANAKASESVTPTADKIAAFGGENLKEEEEKDKLEQVTFVVKAVKKSNFDKLHITFENEQVWYQTDSKSMRLKSGDSVNIKLGFATAIYLNKVGSNRSIRVKRQK